MISIKRLSVSYVSDDFIFLMIGSAILHNLIY